MVNGAASSYPAKPKAQVVDTRYWPGVTLKVQIAYSSVPGLSRLNLKSNSRPGPPDSPHPPTLPGAGDMTNPVSPSSMMLVDSTEPVTANWKKPSSASPLPKVTAALCEPGVVARISRTKVVDSPGRTVFTAGCDTTANTEPVTATGPFSCNGWLPV